MNARPSYSCLRSTALSVLRLIVVLCYAAGVLSAEGIYKVDTTNFIKKEVTIQAERQHVSVSDESFTTTDLALLPKTSTQDVLRLVPGLVLAQHAGGGKAEQIFLRGFDCDHGTDINITVDGLPVNMVSHGHGQGYADLHFVIPECIQSVQVAKGPYFASYGDQATAGAVQIRTLDSLSQNVLKVEGGMFSSYRGLAMLGSHIQSTSIYGAAEYSSTQGYFDEPQHFRRLNLMLKSNTPLSENTSLTMSLFQFSSQWDASGQIPQRAVDEALISGFGSIDTKEGGVTSRTSARIALTSQTSSPFCIEVGLSRYRFDLFSDFTFFAVDSVHGDMIEQTDNRVVATAKMYKDLNGQLWGVGMHTRFGLSTRFDDIDVDLYHAPQRVRLSTTSQAHVQQSNEAAYIEHSMFIDKLSIITGLRADYFSFRVQNQLDMSGTRAQSLIVSPKLNLLYDLNESFSLLFNSGFGFHSNDARAILHSNSQASVPRAFGTEIGARASISQFRFSVAAWLLDLESELVWSGDEGTTESSGRTRRVGIDLDLRYRVTEGIDIGADACTSRGRYRDEVAGHDFIELAPPLTLSAYAVYTSDAVRSALRMRHISQRPANSDNSIQASAYTVVDFTASLPITKNLECSVEVRNILNTFWKEAQFDTSSRLQNEAIPVSEIHFTAGTPRAVKVGVGYMF